MLNDSKDLQIEAIWGDFFQVVEEYLELCPKTEWYDPMDMTDEEHLAFLDGKRETLLQVLMLLGEKDIYSRVSEFLQRLDDSPLNVEVCD